ncbi:MAG: cobalamin-binding protein [Candidatus Dadabacteria bacterium]|nr:MAG: cobalamin-binding protein [Candidatus Dadabacteria bacterium]
MPAEVLAPIRERLVAGDAQGTTVAVRAALDQGIAPDRILAGALIPGMEEVGERFSRGEYFVPELLVAARAMTAAVELLRPLMACGDSARVGKVVLGTVQGDLHDIGKRLVGILLEGSGFEVIDLGCDVAPERFVEAVVESGARLVGLSSLLTTTLPAMGRTVAALRESAETAGVRVMVGGAPVTDAFAREIGADGYGPDAAAAVVLARRLLGIQPPAGC